MNTIQSNALREEFEHAVKKPLAELAETAKAQVKILEKFFAGEVDPLLRGVTSDDAENDEIYKTVAELNQLKGKPRELREALARYEGLRWQDFLKFGGSVLDEFTLRQTRAQLTTVFRSHDGVKERASFLVAYLKEKVTQVRESRGAVFTVSPVSVANEVNTIIPDESWDVRR